MDVIVVIYVPHGALVQTVVFSQIIASNYKFHIKMY